MKLRAYGRALCLTLDMDGPHEYAALHGLGVAAAGSDVMYRGPLQRFINLCQRLNAVGTIFAVGRDAYGAAAARLRAVVADGFEVANHSQWHRYDLSRAPLRAIVADLALAQDALQQATGIAPCGFRAPGYGMSRALREGLQATGMRYDASILPSPPYYALKALVLALYAAQGRASCAQLGPAWHTLLPRRPFRMRPGHLLELPVCVATPLRLPLTGALCGMLPRAVLAPLVRSLRRQPVVTLNMHALDFADLQADGLPRSWAPRQPELRRPVSLRLARLQYVIETLARDRPVMTCAALCKNMSS